MKRVKIFLCVFIVCLCGVVIFLSFAGNSECLEGWASDRLRENPDYDVIVVGGEPEGISAAISSARSGAKTLLLVDKEAPGGLMTYGMLNTIDMSRDKSGNIQTKGIFEEFYKEIGSTESFDVENAKNVFLNLINAEKNLTYLNNKVFDAPIMNGNIITGVSTTDGERYIGKRVIDATADGDVCVAAGVPYFNGREDINLDEKMCTTLVFKVGGVKWKELKEDVERYRLETKDSNSGINKSTAWAFGEWCYDKYTPINKNMRLRGLNIGRQDDGSILINALQIFDVDVKDEQSVKNAKEQGEKEVENILVYLKSILSSFEDAYIIGVADELYIRETRHIKGEYTLTASDLLENTNFYDKIALGSYPIDIQPTNINNSGYVIGVPKQYSIPLRCIVPLNVDNLFIVGKAASYSSVAAGSARVIPVGMVCGESAGIAAVYSIVEDITPREITKSLDKVKELVNILKNQGVYLPEFSIKGDNEDYLGYSQIKKLINLGMLIGGYTNDFGFNTDATSAVFCKTMINLLKRLNSEKYDKEMEDRIKFYWSDDKLSGMDMATIISDVYDMNMNSNDEIWEFIEDKGFLGIFENDVKRNSILTKGQMYYIAVNIVESLLNGE